MGIFVLILIVFIILPILTGYIKLPIKPSNNENNDFKNSTETDWMTLKNNTPLSDEYIVSDIKA